MYNLGTIIEALKFVNCHSHLRENELLSWIVQAENYYSYVVAMGNTKIPTDTDALAKCYGHEIYLAGAKFTPIRTLMLTRRTTRATIQEAHAGGIKAVKFIPGNTSTNSEEGISFFDLLSSKFYGVMEAIETLGMLLLVHAELIKDKHGRIIDEIDRCARALAFLEKIVHDFPDLRLIVEHANDRHTINFVRGTRNVWATLRPQDTILTYSQVCNQITGKITNPLKYALPIAKSEDDRVAVLEAFVGGEDCFAFGTDCAAHLLAAKFNEKKAGIFIPSWVAIPLTVQIFERTERMHNLKKFTIDVPRKIYGLPEVTGTLTLKKEKWQAPDSYHGIPLFLAGEPLDWQIVG